MSLSSKKRTAKPPHRVIPRCGLRKIDMNLQTEPFLSMLAIFQRVGPWEIALILVVVLLLFGGKKLPELARGLARGLKSFKREMREVKDELADSNDDTPTTDQSTPKNKPGNTDAGDKSE